MSTTGRPDESAPAASDVAVQLRDAEFVRLVATADGDALGALGVLAGVLGDAGTPYQASVVTPPEADTGGTDADLTVTLGQGGPAADLELAGDGTVSRIAYEAASDLEAPAPDPILALAGMVAGGAIPDGQPLADAEEAGLDRRPGLAIPVADPVTGLAHSTLASGPFSGSVEAARDRLADCDLERIDEDTRREIASLVALAVAGDEATTPRGARSVERFLRPYVGGPFETVGGYADVLDALARERPGLGVTVALGSGDHEAARAVWRDHGQRTHAAISDASTGRYDGLFVARCDRPAPVGTVARLLAAFRSPEPVVLVVAGGAAVAVSTTAEADLGATMQAATSAVGGHAVGTATWARGQFDGEDTELVVAFREAQ
jgi:hypothetical protein